MKCVTTLEVNDEIIRLNRLLARIKQQAKLRAKYDEVSEHHDSEGPCPHSAEGACTPAYEQRVQRNNQPVKNILFGGFPFNMKFRNWKAN
jgi:hypothetical protein